MAQDGGGDDGYYGGTDAPATNDDATNDDMDNDGGNDDRVNDDTVNDGGNDDANNDGGGIPDDGDNGDDEFVLPDCPRRSIHHCDNPYKTWAAHNLTLPRTFRNGFNNDSSVSCNLTTCEWDLAALRPDSPPEHCQWYDFTRDVVPIDQVDVPDWVEPCAWWHELYGNVTTAPVSAVTNAPTPAPPTPAPTDQPTDSDIGTLQLSRHMWLVYFF
jgi:hypothetical protein